MTETTKTNNNNNNNNNTNNETPESQESKLIQEARNGDAESFKILVDGALKKIKETLKKNFSTINPIDIEEAEASSIIKGFQRFKTFKGDSQFSTWFYTIFKNEILTAIKARTKLNSHEVSLEYLINREGHNDQEYESYPTEMLSEVIVETAQTVLEKKDDMVELQKMLTHVLNKLPKNHKEIIELAYIKELSYKEISDKLNIPIGSVMSRIYYSRETAKKLILQYVKRNELELNLR